MAVPVVVDKSHQPLKLMERVRRAIRARHYSRRTEEAYAYWIRRYIVFHGKSRQSAHVSPFICNSPTGVWARHPNRAGTAWALGCQDPTSLA